jgi:hypothetical protein
VEASVSVYNINGQLITQEEITLNAGSAFSLSALNSQPAGIYVIRIKASEGEQVLRAVKL